MADPGRVAIVFPGVVLAPRTGVMVRLVLDRVTFPLTVQAPDPGQIGYVRAANQPGLSRVRRNLFQRDMTRKKLGKWVQITWEKTRVSNL